MSNVPSFELPPILGRLGLDLRQDGETFIFGKPDGSQEVLTRRDMVDLGQEMERLANHELAYGAPALERTDVLHDVGQEDMTERTIKVHTQAWAEWLNIRPEGYGVKVMENGCGHPIAMEFFQNEFRLLVWADINQEDPTHIISMEGARESLRKEEA